MTGRVLTHPTVKDLFTQLVDGITCLEEVSATVFVAARGIQDARERSALLYLADQISWRVKDAELAAEYLRDALGLKGAAQ